MSIPDFQTCMLPLLKFYGDGVEHANRDSIEALAREYKLSAEEQRIMLPSGVQGLFDNRVNWARTFLKKAVVIEATKRGVHKITKRGLEILKKKPDRIDMAYLRQFQEFKDFRALRHAKPEDDEPELDLNKTPEESLETAYQKLRGDLATELLLRLKAC